MKIKFFKKEKKFKKENFTINVGFYWKSILFLSFALVFSSFVFGFYVFRQINKEVTPSLENTPNTSQIVPKERIDKVLEYFSERDIKSTEILGSPSPVIDPSL